MSLSHFEIAIYRHLDQLTTDVLEITKGVFPDLTLYINALTDYEQITIKVAEHHTSVKLKEGDISDLSGALCHRVDFENQKPLIYENIDQAKDLGDARKLLNDVNIKAYLGIPIVLNSGERFGTLCVANDEPTTFKSESVQLIQRIARLFSFYIEIQYEAYRDHLTKVYNRSFLEAVYPSVSNDKGIIALLDLDGFKLVNDRLGHQVGDEVLMEVAEKLRKHTIGRSSFVVRLGGDEFVMYWPQESAETINQHLSNVLQDFKSWDVDIKECQLSASIGAVSFEKQELLKVLKQADDALYHVKKSGRNNYKLEHCD
ncbi:sensor domain-containing diguanylate cyclase [Paenalkalicoccus suaedae]|uniref:Sensor domain-containing diguanylate cyclase n=1 Tax=Paenalkalicoccus suaedae TaxID=2592382 RepID=A0A859FCK4_9BACI|nr:sensor domain-containing diguanylate cyclase [Paenalkalicoccus suaedae]QKS69995.1 sensor domain-containing diguanylate cyclase [Paenalkalicoccus suaedae]